MSSSDYNPLSYRPDDIRHYRDARPLWCGIVLVGAGLAAVLLLLVLMFRALLSLF